MDKKDVICFFAALTWSSFFDVSIFFLCSLWTRLPSFLPSLLIITTWSKKLKISALKFSYATDIKKTNAHVWNSLKSMQQNITNGKKNKINAECTIPLILAPNKIILSVEKSLRNLNSKMNNYFREWTDTFSEIVTAC